MSERYGSYGPEEQFGRTFGDNKVLGDEGGSFSEKSLDEQVDALAWSEACPVKNYVIKRSGPEEAIKRYGEVIFARQMVLKTAEKHNPELHQALTVTLNRNFDEKVGVHEPTSVPESHLLVINSNSTPWGFSLPRILLDQFGKQKPDRQERMQKGLEILETTVKEVHTPLEFVAVLAERMAAADADRDRVLRSTLSKGCLDEENTRQLYQDLRAELKQHAPTLWKRYTELDSQTREELGIATVPEKEKVLV